MLVPGDLYEPAAGDDSATCSAAVRDALMKQTVSIAQEGNEEAIFVLGLHACLWVPLLVSGDLSQAFLACCSGLSGFFTTTNYQICQQRWGRIIKL